jgi:hypothetical protein
LNKSEESVAAPEFQSPDAEEESPPTAEEPPAPKQLSPHFFRREADGSVRVRIRFTAEEAAVIEEGAGDTPLLLYIHRVLNDRARYHIRKRREVEGPQEGLEEEDDYDER